MTTNAERARIASYLDLSVWSSASRINASEQFSAFAANGVLIPPDVALVSMALLEYEKATFSRLVQEFVLPGDLQLTAEYARSRPSGAPPLPTGTTFLQPWTEQLDQLNASPIILDEWVWHDMPPELYLINDPSLSTSERQILSDMGYGEALRRLESGEKVYEADPAKIAAANEAQAMFVAKWSAAAAQKVIWSFAKLAGKILGYAGGAALGAWFVYRTVDSALERWVHGDAYRADADKAAAERLGNQLQLEKTQALARDLERCRAGVDSGRNTAEQCNALAAALASIQPVLRPEGAPSFPSCGFSNCWPYALLALGGGALVGGLIAKKRGWM